MTTFCSACPACHELTLILGFLDIDIEILLQKDLVTLDEALRNANNAVSKAINAASALISVSMLLHLRVRILKKFSHLFIYGFIQGMHGNFIDVMHKDLKELEGSEVTTVSFFFQWFNIMKRIFFHLVG